MDQVDFGYVGDLGMTIYRVCFQKYENALFWRKPKAELSKMVDKIERTFFVLVEQGINHRYNVDSILEIPDSHGGTCFQIALKFSRKIVMFFLERDIKVNSIQLDMQVPGFRWPDLTIQIMKKGINPYIIDDGGKSKINRSPTQFEGEDAKRLLTTFSRSVHFSIEDIQCKESCPADCPSKFDRFYYKNGPLVEMSEQNRIGKGGFGLVFQSSFHGKPMAMKFTLVGYQDNSERSFVKRVNYQEENISELRIQSTIVGPGVIVPVAFVRQQDQEQDENGEWIALNYDIYIYPLYDCNLHELHENYYCQFTDEILRNVLSQCLTRKCSHR